MAHECEYCGQWCCCDCDDIPFPQPADCTHMSDHGACHEFKVEMGIEEPYEDEDITRESSGAKE